jgi:hypothetical protein
MATPPDSPIEEVVYELETASRAFPKPVPVALEDLCRLTKFTRQEIRIMYRGFKVIKNLRLESLNFNSENLFFPFSLLSTSHGTKGGVPGRSRSRELLQGYLRKVLSTWQ